MTNNGLSRRGFLSRIGALGVVGVSKSLFPAWMPRLAFNAQQQGQPNGDVLVAIFLRGGIDGLSAVVPYGEGANYYDQRPTTAVPEPGSGDNAAVDLDGFFGFHPSLAALKDIYDAGALGVVHATGSTDPSRSHFDAMQFMELGTPGTKTTPTGWIGRHLQATAARSDSPFRAVGMGAMMPSSLRGGTTPLSLRSIGDFHLKGRESELQAAQKALAALYGIESPSDALGSQASAVFQTVDLLKAINAAGYTPEHGALYPQDDEGFGLGLQQVAQLVKADIGLEVATLDVGGWDTHENQGTNDGFFAAHLRVIGEALAAFYADMGEWMRNITVVTMSEFGRRVAENGSSGTDHGHGNFMFVMGGGVRGGQVYADWPTLAPGALNDGDLHITTDYRNVLAEVLIHRLDNPAVAEVFPNFSVTPLGVVMPR
jgi:uncharacterized protein (DUF1501 family)